MGSQTCTFPWCKPSERKFGALFSDRMRKPGRSHTGRESCAGSGASSAFPWLGSEHPPESARSAEEMPGSAVIFFACAMLAFCLRYGGGVTTIQVHPAYSRRMAVPFRNSGGVLLAVCHRWCCCLSRRFKHFKAEIRRDKAEHTDTKHTTQCRKSTWDLTLYRMSLESSKRIWSLIFG